MNRKDLENRTNQFHINVIKFCLQLPKNVACYEIVRQLIRSAGSVAANYRASRRAKSTADFIYKTQVVLEEADESHYWLVVIKEAELSNIPLLEQLIREA